MAITVMFPEVSQSTNLFSALHDNSCTPTISPVPLTLAPSTINQHIKELLAIGAIRQIPNEFVVKQKYYEVNPDFKARREASGQRTPAPEGNFGAAQFKIAAGVALVIALAGALYMFGTGGILFGTGTSGYGAHAPSGTTLFSISDSPTVATVEAVNVTIDSAEAHSTTTGKWYTILNTSKSFNLVKLRNISAVLGVTNIPAGNYDEFVFDVSNVSAVVDNASVSVFIPSSKLRVFGNFSISANSSNFSSWVNIDVNLDKSLHMTGSGKLVLLPVLSIRASNDTQLSLAPNGIVQVKEPGQQWGNQIC